MVLPNQILAVSLLMISHLVIEGSPFPYPVTTDRFLWLSASGIIGLAVGDSCLFKALLIIGPRLSTLMMASVPIFSAIIAWSFLNETLTGLEIFAGSFHCN
ncbi:MAG: EamA family transporter [Deltaproteobacteria bacterium]|jgi:drug/metabolite transporter (DMT)-like permease|nr:EamA family transporter [Deltaproteobacteria bacterium]